MFRLVFFIILLFSLVACTKVVEVPVSVTETDPTEDPIFSTLDFATPQDDSGLGLAVNGSNLYVVGYTEGDLDGTNLGGADAILRRYNGLKLWGLQFGTKSGDYSIKVATDSNGYVYVLGRTVGTLGFQVGSSDIFLVKFNKDGKLLWGKQFGTKDYDQPTDLAIDSNDRIYILSDEGADNFAIRKFRSNGKLLKTRFVTLNNRPDLTPKAITVDSLNNLIVLTNWDNSGNSKNDDIRLFKYNSNLNQLWEKAYSTSNSDIAYDIVTDSKNNIYFTLRIIAVGKQAHVIKKAPTGATLYSKRLEDGATITVPIGIASDDADSIYIIGYTEGSFSGFANAGDVDTVVFKYTSGGTKRWVTQFGINNYGSARDDFANDVAVSGSVYITGYTRGYLLSGGATSYGGRDAYVAQLNKKNGTILGVDQ